MEILVLEHDIGDDAKYGQRYSFLYHLELYEGERTAITLKAQPVGRYLTTIFKEGDTPWEGDHTYQGPVGANAVFLKAEMTIPSYRHKDITEYKK